MESKYTIDMKKNGCFHKEIINIYPSQMTFDHNKYK